MATLSSDDAVAALAEAIREALVQGKDAHVPDLGTFRVAHRPSEAEEQPDGEVVVQPPHNEIVFSPED